MANLANLIVRGLSRLGNVTASKVTAPSFVGTVTNTEFIRGTQSAATGSWTGVTQDTELYDGKEILYFLPFAGSGNATLNLTLADGTTTGAKNCYFSSTTRLTTHYGQYSLIRMTYHKSHTINGTAYEGWWTEPGRDTNDNTYWQLRCYNAVKAAAAITSGYVIVGTSAGYKHVASAVTFDITYPILYAGSNVSSGSTSNNNYEAHQAVNLSTTKASWTGTTYSEVYLVLSALSGTTATIDSTVFTTTQPSSADNKFYIPIGIMYSGTNCIFHAQRRIMAYINGAFQEYSSYSAYAANAGTVNGKTVAVNVPSGAKFTDTTYTAQTTSIGSASAGTAIPADDITNWSAGTAASAAVANGVLTITNGTAPSLSYTAKSIPNISVTATTVATGITAS